MFLTISTTGNAERPATDLGFLLHKHPGKAQAFDTSCGSAHVFYPEADEHRCTAALLLEVDPVALVRRGRGKGRGGAPDSALAQYVNDRPYAASSLLAVALGGVFRSALAGRCPQRPELPGRVLPLRIVVPALPARGGAGTVRRLFEPLGWSVDAEPVRLDTRFPEWGDSRYVRLTLTGELRLAEALRQLYVLLPVLDGAKHYWVTTDEVDKLLRAGEGWLEDHPEQRLVAGRYLARRGVLTRRAMERLELARLAESDDTAAEDLDNAIPDNAVPEDGTADGSARDGSAGDDTSAASAEPRSLAAERRDAILAALHETGAARVLDLGCGEGRLVAALLSDHRFTHVTGLDVSMRALHLARRTLRTDRMGERQASRVNLLQGSLTYTDSRLKGYDAAVLSEVVEHLDPPRCPPWSTPCSVPHARPRSWSRRPTRVQPPLGDAARRPRPPPRPPLRVGPGGVPPLGGAGRRTARLRRGDPARRTRRPRGRAAHPARPVHPAPDGGGRMTDVRTLTVPDLCLVVLVGTTGAGKSTFARRHFLPTEVVSSDTCRGLVADDENDQSATPDAFELLHCLAGKRLAGGRITVVDATNVQSEVRRQLVALAREHDVLPVAIVLDVPEPVCAERKAARPDRAGLPAHVLPRQRRELRRSLRGLEREGFRRVHVLHGAEEVESVRVERERRWNDLRHLTGPFDIVGDVHGCRAELETLLADRLGYRLENDGRGRAVGARHPEGRTAVFVGDLVDRGPDSPGVLRLVMGMVAAGTALCVPGNHENKLGRLLKGRRVKVSHGLAETVEQLEKEDPDFPGRVREFVDSLVSHYVLDGGALVVCHAGLPEKYHGRTSGRVRSHALYGETTGETDEFGLPVRYPWAEDYRGRAAVVYGHTPVPRASWLNNTLCLDTGCVFGGALTALRWPERALVDVPAERVWYGPVRPLATEAPGGADGRPLDLADVHGRRIVETRHAGRISVREENAAAALEVMSRFALAPGLLPYLPPTMAPCATSREPGWLEHPAEAFTGYRADGVREVVCQEKHMGSRAVLLVCREAEVARERFGASGEVPGALYTRTGRPFFKDEALTAAILRRVADSAGDAGLWEELDTDWMLLDAELMPWSLKAAGLLREQYAAVGAAAGAVLPEAVAAVAATAARGVDVGGLLERQRGRLDDAAAFTEAYRRYCWPVGDPERGRTGEAGGRSARTPGRDSDGLDGIRLAPFQVLAVRGRSLAALPHDRQLALIDRMVDAEGATARRAEAGGGPRADRLLAPTRRLYVDTHDEASVAEGVHWWLEVTGAGAEGMVVKPRAAYVRGANGRPVQPGVKVRGREYLRIVYGAEYTRPGNLERLRVRHLGHKRSLAQREYALGLEALDRLADGEPLWRVHEAVFAVLALESEPVDPRL